VERGVAQSQETFAQRCKQLSIETINLETIKNVTFGKGMASGVYQVVITQGENKETFKVIKN
jgi:hypothetical protein